MSLPGPATLWRTLRHLRFRQVRYQLAKRLLAKPALRPLPLHWRVSEPLVVREKNDARSRFDGISKFTFNNEMREFRGDWNDRGARKLWLYNLHYMSWLFDIQGDGALSEREEWIRRWIRDNPPVDDNGWDPYPLSLRLFNWCKHYASSPVAPAPDILASMELQAGSLLSKLEFHLDGNHLLENLLALTFIGFHLDPRSSRARTARARIDKWMKAELSAQFLPDGGHYELSPMYHAILLERLLDLLNCWPPAAGTGGADEPFPGLREQVRSTALVALDWLETMTVAGRFALFNDSAYDTAPEASLLLEYGNALLGRQAAPRAFLKTLEASGYFRAEAGPATVIFDAGKLAPDHQMGHAQGDMLSFCLWLGEHPVLVHPGNYEYVPGNMRDYCRSTASHNTLVVDGEEQAEWWAAHRVGRRGYSFDVSAAADPASGVLRLRGSHNGFTHLAGSPVHTREIEMTASSVAVRDHLSALPKTGGRVYFHLHPDCTVRLEKGGARIESPAGVLRFEADGPLHLEDSWYCPEFGVKIRNQAMVIDGKTREYRSVFLLESPRPAGALAP
jgi:uncharacterized heparinase superfamily protein